MEPLRLAGAGGRLRRHRDPSGGVLRRTGRGDAAGAGTALDARGARAGRDQVRAGTGRRVSAELHARCRVVGAVFLRAGIGQRPGCAALPSRRRRRGGFVLNGQKIWTSQGPTATTVSGPGPHRHPGEPSPRFEHNPGRRRHPGRNGATDRARQRSSRIGRGVFRRRPRAARTADRRRRRGLGRRDAPDAVRARDVRLRHADHGADRTESAARGNGHPRFSIRRQTPLRSDLHCGGGRTGTRRDHRARAGGRSHGRSEQQCRQIAVREGREGHQRPDPGRPARLDDRGSGRDDSKALDATRAKWWYTRAATIMGGSAEVQRGIIADHLLGLPKEKR